MEKRFGCWIVNKNGIELNSEFYKDIDYNIDMTRLLQFGQAERKGLYDWLIHLTEKKWIKVEDIRSLNEAFIFACEKYNLTLDWNIYENTLDQQSVIISKRK